ncbi:hypothetical protein MW887_001554 [Aspergillus wentii]|nr:hypothetical protein MW887_001554 [Aspergillus wentii]
MSDSGYSTDEDVDNNSSSVSRILDALLTPFRALVSKQALKAYLVAYWIFYYKFIPQVGLERTVHLQFGDGHPWGAASVGSQLVSLQPYDVTIKLELPRTPSNLDAGNFMLDLTLFSHPSTSVLTGANTSIAPISHSRRPAILTYASPMVDTASRLSLMPLYVVGWHREAEEVEVQMMERVEFPRGWRNLPETLRLEIQSHERMQIYDAKVEFKARFTGLRWIMYNWRLSSFFVFTFMFWSVSVISTGVVWFILAVLFSTNNGGSDESLIKGTSDRTPIKEESDDESLDDVSPHDLSGTNPSQIKRIKTEHHEEESKPDYLLSQPHGEGDYSQGDGGEGSSRAAGAGTGLESAEARGVQRRRSHLIKEEDEDS